MITCHSYLPHVTHVDTYVINQNSYMKFKSTSWSLPLIFYLQNSKCLTIVKRGQRCLACQLEGAYLIWVPSKPLDGLVQFLLPNDFNWVPQIPGHTYRVGASRVYENPFIVHEDALVKTNFLQAEGLFISTTLVILILGSLISYLQLSKLEYKESKLTRKNVHEILSF